ncbi:MAG TPA: cysteine hydrolase family protein [Desulfomonilaceae bacterium]|nr:cysteine hydrolase family protein [Desulfomonilaceae bacterium]
MMTTALLLIDIQNDYFPGGKMELEGSVEASLRAKALLAWFRERKMPVLHIQHISTRPGATFFLPETEGVEIHDNVRPLEGETVIRKHSMNSFRDTSLSESLEKEGTKHVVICGMMTHMCVDATTRAAFDVGLKCTVISDACATKTLKFGETVVPGDHVQAAFLAALNAGYANVVTVEDFISGLR